MSTSKDLLVETSLQLEVLEELITKYLPLMNDQILIMCDIQEMQDDFEKALYGFNEESE